MTMSKKNVSKFLSVFAILVLSVSMLLAFVNAISVSPVQGPVIDSVSPIAATLTQSIVIRGSGFGDTQPQLLSLGDGSVDTVWGGSTPRIVIYDERNELSAGATGNWSGFTNGSPDLIGVVLVIWS